MGMTDETIDGQDNAWLEWIPFPPAIGWMERLVRRRSGSEINRLTSPTDPTHIYETFATVNRQLRLIYPRTGAESHHPIRHIWKDFNSEKMMHVQMK